MNCRAVGMFGFQSADSSVLRRISEFGTIHTRTVPQRTTSHTDTRYATSSDTSFAGSISATSLAITCSKIGRPLSFAFSLFRWRTHFSECAQVVGIIQIDQPKKKSQFRSASKTFGENKVSEFSVRRKDREKRQMVSRLVDDNFCVWKSEFITFSFCSSFVSFTTSDHARSPCIQFSKWRFVIASATQLALFSLHLLARVKAIGE